MQFPFLLQEHIMTGDWLRTKDMDHLSTVIREETVVMKVFDFDNTIYRGESSIDLAVYMIRNNKKIILYLPMIFTNLVKYKLCMVGRKEMEIILNDFCQAVMGDKDEVPEIIDRFWQIHAHKLNRKILKRIAKEDFAIIYITEQVYQFMMDEVDEYTDSRLPAIIPIPGKDGTLGIGMTSVKKSVERAVGADILFGGDN